jgi:hypothetical protein
MGSGCTFARVLSKRGLALGRASKHLIIPVCATFGSFFERKSRNTETYQRISQISMVTSKVKCILVGII